MKERPILFSAPMVRALLAGTKSQTRRIVKPRPSEDICLPINAGLYHPTCVDRHGEEYPGTEVFGAWSDCGAWVVKCPYGQPGDRLWVRESFQPLFAEGFEHGDGLTDWGTGAGYAIRYVATDGATEWIDGDDEITSRCKPSIHMPRWASRLTLEITGVRVERLQSISQEDAVAEGVTDWMVGPTSPRDDYRGLWESINGPGSWELNPWVWVVSFRRLEVSP